MKFQDLLQNKKNNTAKISDLNRGLAFAGIAIVWIFKGQEEGHIIPQVLKLPFLLFIVALIFDFIQYLILSWNDIRFFKKIEPILLEKKKQNPKIDLNNEEVGNYRKLYIRFANIFWYLKFLTIALAYILLASSEFIRNLL